MKKSGFSLYEITVQDLISLTNMYLAEWTHRDELFWMQVFRYFYVTIIIIFLPNIAKFLQITLPDKLPYIAFPVTGFFMSFFFGYVSIGYAKRVEAIGKTYCRLIMYLPPDLRRYSLLEIKNGKYFRHTMSYILCVLMFAGCLSLSIVMIFYYKTFGL